MYYQNLQIGNTRRLSKYPFTQNSTLLVGKYLFPSHLITSISLDISKAAFPLYINKIYAQYQSVFLQITDNKSSSIGKIEITQKGTSIYNDSCVQIGRMGFNSQLYSWLLQVVKNTVYGYIQLDSQALVLDGSVIHCIYYVGFTGLSINEKYVGNDVTLNFQRNIKTTISGSNIKLDIYGDYSYPYQTKKKLQYVNGVDLKGKALQIKSRALSNLRTATQTNRISFIGVTDAT